MQPWDLLTFIYTVPENNMNQDPKEIRNNPSDYDDEDDIYDDDDADCYCE